MLYDIQKPPRHRFCPNCFKSCCVVALPMGTCSSQVALHNVCNNENKIMPFTLLEIQCIAHFILEFLHQHFFPKWGHRDYWLELRMSNRCNLSVARSPDVALKCEQVGDDSPKWRADDRRQRRARTNCTP